MDEAAALIPFEKDGLEIQFKAYPTLTDGKVKVMWSEWEKKAMTKCYICGAGPKKLAKRKPRGGFKPNKRHYNFGLACLHVRMNAFLWLCKFYLYKDIKAYSKTKEQEPLIKKRMEELQQRFWDRLKLKVFKCTPGQLNSNFCSHAIL